MEIKETNLFYIITPSEGHWLLRNGQMYMDKAVFPLCADIERVSQQFTEITEEEKIKLENAEAPVEES